MQCDRPVPGSRPLLIAAVALAACGTDQPRPRRPPPGAPTGAVEILVPARLTTVDTGERDALGRPIRATCATCHSLRPPAAVPTSTAELDEFHQGLRFDHGDLGCASCHAAGQPPRLHRADGTEVALEDTIVLCRTCHGPQARDYDHGAHGGMTGHWDLSAGGRQRNHCVSCHDPHTPAFLPSQPVLLPRDRGLTAGRNH